MLVTDIQQGCTHDGPGLRTVVFLKGCPLHCPWCHNPETQKPGKELFFREDRCIGCMECFPICSGEAHTIRGGDHILDRTKCVNCMQCARVCYSGVLEEAQEEMTVDQVLARVEQDRVFYRETGGLTVSGGEPTMQSEALLQLLRGAKAAGIHTCLETCGVFPSALTESLAGCTDLVLFDIKDTDPVRLEANTGAKLHIVKENLLTLDRLGLPTILRCLLIPGINMEDTHAQNLIAIFRKLKNCQAVELLGYHPYGLSKSEQLGRNDPEFPQPDPESLRMFADILLKAGIPVKLQGSML